MPHVLLALLLAALPACVWCAVASDFLSRTLPAGSAPHPLPYRLLVPAGYNSANSYPLILFLHGAGEMGTDNQAQLFYNANGALQLVSTTNQAAHPCFMLAPQAYPGAYWSAQSQGQIITVIDQLLSEFSIDRERIYVTGLSMGGGGTWDIITRYPGTFAAAVPQSSGGTGNYQRIVDLPVWVFHANNDADAPVSGSDNAVAGLRNAGGRVIYTRYGTGGHGIWPAAYATPALLPWMMAQRRNRTSGATPILAITAPAASAVANASANITLAGTCSFPTGSTIAAIDWTTNLTTVTGTSFSTVAASATWTASGLAVANGTTLFTVIATGPSWSGSNGGVTTVSDCIRVVRSSSDTTAPTIAITSPASSGSASVTSSTVTVGGSAGDAGGGGVQQITWTNNRGGQGTAQGTTAWSIPAITLATGANLVTVTVRDGANLMSSASITITTTSAGGPGGGGGGGGGASSGSSSGCGSGSGLAVFALLAWLGVGLHRLRRSR